MNAPDLSMIPDVQSLQDNRLLAINRVGIKAIRHPLLVRDADGNEQHTVALCNMYVGLPHHVKGTHMSRFIDMLNSGTCEVSVDSFEALLREMTDRLEAQTGYIEFNFPFFIRKTAPVSGVVSLMDYEVTLTGEITADNHFSLKLKVQVPVTSLCPCSKKISRYGAHNQRSHITVTATLNAPLAIETLVRQVEQQASCELYALLKRPDEKFVTERAYDNPKFVEDAVRDVAGALNLMTEISAYVVESENFESIHNHSAYAMIEKA